MHSLRPAIAIVLSLSAAALAGPAYDSPEAAKADPDYALQGEYEGVLDDGTGRAEKIGVQVIALGKGRFRAVSFRGGLPGDGFAGEPDDRDEVEGQAQGNTVTFTSEGYTGRLADGRMTVSYEGKEIGTLKKVERKSRTLGLKPPQEAVVLFDGSQESLKNWQNGAKITEDGLLTQGVTSKQKFGDHTIHVEFRLPFQPEDRGQSRGNSGLYLQGRYEVQMLDSFGLEGKDNECGGIYKVGRPRVHMCYPPLAWQTYDVEFTAAKFDAQGNKTAPARMTVYHNGVKIHDNIEIPGPTAAAPVMDEKGPGPVFLQDHGNPVRYRNIWVVERK